MLIFGERLEGADQQAGATTGPQPGVDLVQIAGAGTGGEQINDPLHQLGEEGGVVDLARTGGELPMTGAVVQEHQVEVGAVIQFNAAQLSVSDNGEARIPLHAFHHAPGLAEPGQQIRPGQLQHLPQQDFGDFG
jgi:hypothetical protein